MSAEEDAVLFKLADDAFVVMNWARKQGLKRDGQIEQVVAAFKKTLADGGIGIEACVINLEPDR